MIQEYESYFIKPDGSGFYTISNVGKGVLPVFLRGIYTSPAFAKQQIDGYLEMRTTKNGKTVSGS